MAGAVPTFSKMTADISSPITALRTAVTGANLPDGVCKAFIVTVAGNVEVIAEDDTVAVSLGAVAVNLVMPIRVKQFTNNTTATIVAGY